MPKVAVFTDVTSLATSVQVCVRDLSVRVWLMSIGMPGGNAHKGVCIPAGVAAVGGCEQRKENSVCVETGYVINVGAE
jgi:hypothetical protein